MRVGLHCATASSCHVTSSLDLACQVMPHHITSSHVTLCHVMPCHVVSCQALHALGQLSQDLGFVKNSGKQNFQALNYKKVHLPPSRCARAFFPTSDSVPTFSIPYLLTAPLPSSTQVVPALLTSLGAKNAASPRVQAHAASALAFFCQPDACVRLCVAAGWRFRGRRRRLVPVPDTGICADGRGSWRRLRAVPTASATANLGAGCR